MALVLAHRGANRFAPGNTLPAFARAVELGADGVELDIHRTADGALVVRHDAATPVGMLAEMTVPEIRAALPEVPTLEEALDVCAGLLVNVEIKNVRSEGDWDPTDRAADLLVELLARRDGRDRVLVSSFNLTSVDRVRSLAPHLPTALLTWGTDPLEALLIAESHGHGALHPDYRSIAGVLAGAVATRAHEQGLEVNVWTVNDPDELARLAAAGIDALITDVPDVALQALGRRA
ncbi:MAG: glycerophosphodiester phosphodiesterase family protein [Acidimicrobiia bacterium]